MAITIIKRRRDFIAADFLRPERGLSCCCRVVLLFPLDDCQDEKSSVRGRLHQDDMRWHCIKSFPPKKWPAQRACVCERESKKTPLSLGVVPHESRVRRNFTDLSARFAFGFSTTHQAPCGTAYYSLLQTVEMRLTLVLCTLCFALKSPPQRRGSCIRSVESLKVAIMHYKVTISKWN